MLTSTAPLWVTAYLHHRPRCRCCRPYLCSAAYTYTTQPKIEHSFRPKETIFELLGGGGTVAKGDMEEVMGAVRKRARVHRLLTRNETTPGVEEARTAASANVETPPPQRDGEQGGGAEEGDSSGGGSQGGREGTPSEAVVKGGDNSEGRPGLPADGGGSVSAKSSSSSINGGAAEAMDVEDRQEEEGVRGNISAAAGTRIGNGNGGGGAAATVGVKRKLSRFERKRAKKLGKGGGGEAAHAKGGGDALAGLEDELDEAADGTGGGMAAAGGAGEGGVMGNGGPGRFADKSFYIGYGTT